MSSPLQTLHRIPVLGYLLRLVSSIARLPRILQAHERGIQALQDAHARLGAAEAALGAQQQFAQGLEAGLKIHWDQLEAARADIARVRQASEAFEQHMPAVLNLIGSHGATSRLLRREQQHALEKVESWLAEARKREGEAGDRIAALIEERQRERAERTDGQLKAHDERFAGLDAAIGAIHRTLASLEAAAQAAEPALDDFQERVHRLEQRFPRFEDEARRLEEGLRHLEARHDDGAPGVESLRTDVAGLRSSVEFLLKRVEFVRQETLFELRYGARSGSGGGMEPRVIDEEKVARAQREGIRLNIGCGHIPLEGYVNVDVRELPGVDVVAEATRLPFDPGTVTEVFCAHLLEHFPEEQLRRSVLPYWRSLLREGGELRCVVPDAASMIERFSKGGMPFADLREVTFGGQDYDGDFHYTMFSPDSLMGILAGAGFGQVRLTAVGRENGKCLEMEAVGVR